MSKSAIDAPRLNAWAVSPSDLVIVGLDTHNGPEHPLYDERVLLPVPDAFVADIRALGILEPVKVRKNGNLLEVVAGRQRVRAAREVNRTGGDLRVPVMLERGDDARMRDVGLSENEHRVNDSHEVKIRKLVRYLASGRTEHEAAVRFGVSGQTIKNWLALAEAGPEVKAAVAAGEITSTEAVKIARKPRETQALAVRTPKPVVPGKRQIKRLTEADALLPLVGEPGFEAGFLAALKWVTGELQTSDIDGLGRCLETGEK
jgi:ParB family chromosome partitioning protein